MAYREFAPPPGLRTVVECGWSAALDDGEEPHIRSVLPDGCMDLIWDGTELLVAGPDTVAHQVVRATGPPVVGLRFAPGALPGLLGVPAAAVRDERVPLAELDGRAARVAAGRISAATGALTALLDVTQALPGRPERMAGELVARIGAGSGVAATADALGCTPRTVHRRCLDAFGYGPAVLHRVLRFRRAAALLFTGTAPADVAAVTGYADQPHLSREVRALAGVSPRQLASGANRSTPLPSGSSTTA